MLTVIHSLCLAVRWHLHIPIKHANHSATEWQDDAGRVHHPHLSSQQNMTLVPVVRRTARSPAYLRSLSTLVTLDLRATVEETVRRNTVWLCMTSAYDAVLNSEWAICAWRGGIGALGNRGLRGLGVGRCGCMNNTLQSHSLSWASTIWRLHPDLEGAARQPSVHLNFDKK